MGLDAAARARVLQLAVWLLLLGDLLLLGWWNQILAPAGTVLLLLFALAGGLGLWLLKGDARLPATPLDAGFGLLALAVILSSFFAMDPGRSWRAGWQWLACIWLFYWAVVVFRRGWSVATFTRGLLLVVALLMAAAYYQLYLWLAGWYAAGPWPMLLPPGLPRIWGITISSNIFAVLLNMALLLLLGYWQEAQRRLPLLMLWLLAALPLLLLPASRSGWLGLMAGLALFWLGGRLAAGELRRLFTGRSGRRLLLAAAVGLTLFLLLVALLRPGSLDLTDGSDVGFRTRFWLVALDAWRSAPLLGKGLNSYASFYMQQYPAPYGIIYVAAHNLYLQGLADMGLLGLAPLLLLTAQVAALVWARRTRLADPWNRGLLAALAAFGVHALFDTPESWVAAPALLCLAALLVRLYPEPPLRRWAWPALAWSAGLPLLLLGGLLGNLAAHRYAGALRAAEAGAWTMALAELEAASRLLPWPDGAMLLAAGQIRGALARYDAAHGPDAAAALEQLRSLEPGWSATPANLAALYRQLGENDAAHAALTEARHRAPESPIYWLNGALWQLAADQAAAADDMAATLALERTWSGAPIFAPFAAAPPAATPPAPDLATAEAAVAADPADTAAYLALGIARLQAGEDAGAADALRRAAALDIVRSPLGQGTRLRSSITLWQALLPEAHQQRQALAHRFLEQSAYGPAVGAAGSYPTVLFLRPGLPVDLLPQLRCPAVTAAQAAELTAARAWAVEAGRNELADWLNQLLLGDGDGTRSCWPAAQEREP